MARDFSAYKSVVMEHPDLPGQDITVPELSVAHHERAGWKLKEEKPAPVRVPKPEGKPNGQAADNAAK